MEKIAGRDGEVIEIGDGAVIVVEKDQQGPFDARLVIDKGDGQRLTVDLKAREARKVSTALKEAVIGAKHRGRE